MQAAWGRIVSPICERRIWQDRLERATSYEEWSFAAEKLDRLEGKDAWRSNPVSSEYDYELVKMRLDQLQNAHEMQDNAAISFLLRTSLARNFADISREMLFGHCRNGTKHLIEQFNEQKVASLRMLGQNIAHSTNPVELKSKMDLFKELRHSLGNTALLLSGGAYLGIYHVGVMKALYESGLLPRIIAGSSSGAIMAAFACCSDECEFPRLFQLQGINFHMLEGEPSDEHERSSWAYSSLQKLFRLLRDGVIFDAKVLENGLRSNIGDITFLESYQKTNRVLNVTVSSSTIYDMPGLLNYMTAPNVLVWSAVVASCALPALFDSAPLLAKDRNGCIVPWHVTGDLWIDGSVENDLPMNRLSELFNVNHFIVSQVNVHINPFMKYVSNGSCLRGINKRLLYLVRSEINHRLDQFASLGILPWACKMIKSVLSQKYAGDITIVPKLSWDDMLHMLSDRPANNLQGSIKGGERSTWPKISLIRNQLQAELTLDQLLLDIRDRLLDIGHSTVSLEQLPAPRRGSVHGNMSTAEDVMLDPIVDIRRHISPVVLANDLGPLQKNEQANHHQHPQLNGHTTRRRSQASSLLNFDE